MQDAWAAPDGTFNVAGDGIQIFDGEKLKRVYTDGLQSNLVGIHGLDGSDIWAVSGKGVLLHYNGTFWERPTVTDAEMALISFYDIFVGISGAAAGEERVILLYGAKLN